MKFYSTYPSLQVILQNKKKIVDEYGAVMFDSRPIVVRFDMGIYESRDENITKLMLAKIEDLKNRGMAPSFQVYPDEGLPKKEEPVMDKEDLNKELALKNEIILDQENKMAEMQTEIDGLKKQVAELSQLKKPKKSPATAN